MRAGFTTSIMGHILVIFWGLISFPSIGDVNSEIEYLPVELVTIEEETSKRLGTIEAEEILEEAAPQESEVED